MTAISTALASPRLARAVARTVRRHKLIEAGDHILVAVSGGPDSVALLSWLASWADDHGRGRGFSVSAAHVNHALRGVESEQDAKFVASLCEQIGVEFVSERVPLAEAGACRTRPKGVSLQEYARELRYAALVRMADRLGASKIALGHTADDQAETLLMWMLRGSGAGGLAGIPPVRERLFIRPLLEVRRADILAYLRARELEFRTDSSNAKPLYLRNRVRHELLPFLRQFNPGIVGVLNRQADILREEHVYLEAVARGHVARLVRVEPDGEVVLDRTGLLALAIALQRRVLRAIMRQMTGAAKGPGFAAVELVLERVVQGRSGTEAVVEGVHVAREYGRIRFRPASAARTERARGVQCDMALPVPVPSDTVWPLTGQTIRLHWDEPGGKSAMAGSSGRNQRRAIFDPARFTNELVIRTWRPGDTFQPLGMAGRRKKLQDFFADLKVPRGDRSRVPVLVAPEGILWVVGYRADHRFCAGFCAGPSTRRRLVAELAGPPERT